MTIWFPIVKISSIYYYFYCYLPLIHFIHLKMMVSASSVNLMSSQIAPQNSIFHLNLVNIGFLMAKIRTFHCIFKAKWSYDVNLARDYYIKLGPNDTAPSRLLSPQIRLSLGYRTLWCALGVSQKWLTYHCMKSPLIHSFSGLYFPPLGLNTEIYSVNLCILSKWWIIQTRKTPRTLFTQCTA